MRGVAGSIGGGLTVREGSYGGDDSAHQTPCVARLEVRMFNCHAHPHLTPGSPSAWALNRHELLSLTSDLTASV
jgi:hypothetical protein